MLTGKETEIVLTEILFVIVVSENASAKEIVIEKEKEIVSVTVRLLLYGTEMLSFLQLDVVTGIMTLGGDVIVAHHHRKTLSENGKKNCQVPRLVLPLLLPLPLLPLTIPLLVLVLLVQLEVMAYLINLFQVVLLLQLLELLATPLRRLLLLQAQTLLLFTHLEFPVTDGTTRVTLECHAIEKEKEILTQEIFAIAIVNENAIDIRFLVLQNLLPQAHLLDLVKLLEAVLNQPETVTFVFVIMTVNEKEIET